MLEPLTRWLKHRIGWEISSAIENVIFSVVLAIVLLCCCLFGMAAVAWQIFTNQ